MSCIAIIPARGGSKRIPRKNIKDFLGKPIIAYSIEIALKSNLFDEVMVSTDDEEIANVAKQYGATVPFFRSNANANDFATLADVLIEVVQSYQKIGKSINALCCILPTAPLTSSERVCESYTTFSEKNYDSICPVVEYSYPIQRALEININNRLRMIHPENLTKRSQDLSASYHDSGSFYWVNSKALIEEQSLFCKNGGAVVIPELEVQDIDTETDWRLAELKYSLLHE
ncbi:pseudaminic acid cytidylyltransferase [Carboxylicivirga sp. N1Y90]|uniref:pseudaminic acid cytidylyltransferase n=1 Tax=Carboxylicivirga fragile TaxID=3417571 RepID=UPI003D345304|nr:pseudaminic acid cytidylyltransferase [Marinilabiliaceae bacterium N1Y90]